MGGEGVCGLQRRAEEDRCEAAGVAYGGTRRLHSRGPTAARGPRGALWAFAELHIPAGRMEFAAFDKKDAFTRIRVPRSFAL